MFLFLELLFAFSGVFQYLSSQGVYLPPGPFWFCTITTFLYFWTALCSTLFLVSVTFDRFYGILKPHKAASMNTAKRAKLTIAGITIFSCVYNIPHLFITSNDQWKCLPYGIALRAVYGEIYYWFSFIVQFAFPFVCFLGMNSYIIHALRKRSNLGESDHVHHANKSRKTKNSEGQVFAILILVTFAFLILTTPAYCFFLYIMFYDVTKTPTRFVGYTVFYHIAHKLDFTNNAINFFLYVVSGTKFRSDLKLLVNCGKEVDDTTNATSITSVSN